MANGSDTRIKCTKKVPYGIKGGANDEPATFIDVDMEASDGVVHIIDNVLFYPNMKMEGAASVVDMSSRSDIP